MKISMACIFKNFFIAGFILFAQLSFAVDPTPIPIPPDGTSDDPPVKPYALVMLLNQTASATISDTELAVYFEWSVGDATISVYDTDNNVVYQETVDTDITTEVNIPIVNWLPGDYMITVTYGNITQRGYFSLE